MKLGQYEAAVREYTSILTCEPKNRDARVGLLRAIDLERFREGEIQRASNDTEGVRPESGNPSTYKPGDVQVERYPLLDAPIDVLPDQEFAIQVSLTNSLQTPEVKIEHGEATPAGKLKFAMPPLQDSWRIDVVLSAPGVQWTRGSNIGSIDLTLGDDTTTAAVFYGKVLTNTPPSAPIHVVASYWYQGRYLARVARDIRVVNSLDPMKPLRQVSWGIGRKEIGDSPAELSDNNPEPDLTILISGDGITVNSPYLQPSSGKLKDAQGFSRWLEQNAAKIASSGRGSELVPSADGERAEGFGLLLYENYAPDVFKQAFWALVKKRGSKFRTIQIYSDDPQFPWELMRPSREDGTFEQGFLGTNYSVARWHVTDDGTQRERPPSSEMMSSIFVIAPHYTGVRTLDGELMEGQELSQLDGYKTVDGNLNALRELFRHPPQGILHFAGHGELSQDSGDYAILLEDGELDTTTWRGIAKGNETTHPFFFFNACDVGRARHAGNFVDGWAPAVLSGGASGFIGALWPVNDEIAAKFAVRFYQLLQQEMRVGPADVSAILQRTRREIYHNTGNPTALGYVLYGDTNLRFVK